MSDERKEEEERMTNRESELFCAKGIVEWRRERDCIRGIVKWQMEREYTTLKGFHGFVDLSFL